MSSIYRLRITAGPSVGAAVHADMSTDDVWINGGTLDLGSPDVSFDRSGLPLEGVRQISMSVHVSGTGAQAGIVMQQIARAISVPDRWLMLQRTHDTDPVWYRLHPRSPGGLDMDRAYVDSKLGFWTWALSLTVDSTAVGERRAAPSVATGEVTTTVPNSGSSRGVVIDAPGEAPAPLRVDVQPDQTMNGKRVLISTYSVPWDSPLVSGDEPSIIMNDDHFYYSEELADRVTGKPFLSGGTGVSMTMDTTDYRVWIRGPGNGGPSKADDLEPGRYLVLARLYREGSTGEAEVRMGEQWASQDAWQPWRTWRPTAGGDRSSWVPLGYLQHPYGQSGDGLLPGQLMPPTIRVAARVTTTSATSTMYLDQVAFLPVDLARGSCEVATFAQFEQGIGAGPTHMWQFDAERRRVTTMDWVGKYHASPSPLRTGGWPVAVPGMATGVSVFLDTSDAPTGVDPVTVSTEVTVNASPRMLHVGRER